MSKEAPRSRNPPAHGYRLRPERFQPGFFGFPQLFSLLLPGLYVGKGLLLRLLSLFLERDLRAGFGELPLFVLPLGFERPNGRSQSGEVRLDVAGLRGLLFLAGYDAQQILLRTREKGEMILQRLSYAAGLVREFLDAVYAEKLGEDLLDIPLAVPGEALRPLVPEVRYEVELRGPEYCFDRLVVALRRPVRVQGLPAAVHLLVEIALLLSFHRIDGDHRFMAHALHCGNEYLAGIGAVRLLVEAETLRRVALVHLGRHDAEVVHVVDYGRLSPAVRAVEDDDPVRDDREVYLDFGKAHTGEDALETPKQQIVGFHPVPPFHGSSRVWLAHRASGAGGACRAGSP